MAEFVPNQLTVRERALAALEQAIRTQPMDDYGFAWDLVMRAPLRDWAYRKQRSLGIFDGRETKRDLHMVRECSLTVALEIKLVVQSSAQPSSEMNAYFGAVQRRLAEDPTLGGLVIDLVETSNDSDVEDETYRKWDATRNEFVPGTCPYAGDAKFTAKDAPTDAAHLDVCSHKLSGCKARFGADGELPFSGFPAVSRTR